MISRFMVSALCLLTLPPCAAYAGNINGEATYISFFVPGAVGTYPTGINDSMEVTGYYTDLKGTDFGFLRHADGTIITFLVPGALWTQAVAINAAGDITGVYNGQAFLRRADGRFITFYPPQATAGGAEPTSLNDFDEVVGIVASHALQSFTRSRKGVVSTLQAPGGGPTTALGINDSGSIVGYFAYQGGFAGFVAHPDGYWSTISIPADPGCAQKTVVNSINAAGAITGSTTDLHHGPECIESNDRGFVMTREGELTFFQPPGSLQTGDLSVMGDIGRTATYININDVGDVAGSYQDSLSVVHGFVRNPYGTLTTFDPPEGKNTFVHGINSGGVITGSYEYRTGG